MTDAPYAFARGLLVRGFEAAVEAQRAARPVAPGQSQGRPPLLPADALLPPAAPTAPPSPPEPPTPPRRLRLVADGGEP